MVGTNPITGKRQVGRRAAKKAIIHIKERKQQNRLIAAKVLQQYNPNQPPSRLLVKSEKRERVIRLYMAGGSVEVISKEMRSSKGYVRQTIKDIEEELAKWDKQDCHLQVFGIFQSITKNHQSNQLELLLQRLRIETHRGRCQDYLEALASGRAVPDGSPRSIEEGINPRQTLAQLSQISPDSPGVQEALKAHDTAQKDHEDRLRKAVQGLRVEIEQCDTKIRVIMAEQRANDKEQWALLSQMGVPDVPTHMIKGSHTPQETSSEVVDTKLPLLTDGTVDIERIKEDEAASLERRLAYLRGKDEKG